MKSNKAEISKYVSVRSAGPGKGLGMFANIDIPNGTVLFRETPLVHSKSRRRRALEANQLVCMNCNRYLAGVDVQLRLLTGELSLRDLIPSPTQQQSDQQSPSFSLPLRIPPPTPLSILLSQELSLPTLRPAKAIRIQKTSNESEVKNNDVNESSHDPEESEVVFTCDDPSCESKLVTLYNNGGLELHRRLSQHRNTDNTIFSLAGQLISVLSSEPSEADVEWERKLEPVLSLVRRPYGDTVDGPEDPDERAEYVAELNGNMGVALQHICETYQHVLSDSKHTYMTEQLYAYRSFDLLVGSLCLNTKQIVVPNPMVFLLAQIERISDPAKKSRIVKALTPLILTLKTQAAERARAQQEKEQKRLLEEEEQDESEGSENESEESESESESESDEEEEMLGFTWHTSIVSGGSGEIGEGSENPVAEEGSDPAQAATGGGAEREMLLHVSSSLFPASRSDGLFLQVARVNHSCEPNSAVIYPERSGNTAVVMSLREIKAGSEITKTYINQDGSFEERSLDLKSYGFTCDCNKCARDIASGSGNTADINDSGCGDKKCCDVDMSDHQECKQHTHTHEHAQSSSHDHNTCKSGGPREHESHHHLPREDSHSNEQRNTKRRKCC